MKKVFSVVAIAAFAVASMSSCKKCGTCTVLGVTSEEVCGSSSEISASETSCELAGGSWETKY